MQRKPLKQTTKLVAKATLKKKKIKSLPTLIKLADAAFSRAIRIRDSEKQADGSWVGVCITCPRKLVVITAEGKWIASSQNGHLIGRGTFSLRYSDENCSLQCAHCNVWMDKDEMITSYRKAVDDKYGDGTYKKLKAASKLPDAFKRPTKPELLQIIEDSKTELEFYLKP